MENSLIPMDITPVKLFTEKGLEPILSEIKKKVDEFEPDIETAKGRKEIASFAHKIAQSKVFIDKAGKELVADQKAQIKLIDTERKRSRDFLDEQKDRARKPLTEWEEAEKKRIEEEERKIRFEADWTAALDEDDLFNRQREIERKEAELARQEEEKRQKEEAERLEKERIEREDRLKKEAAEQAKKEAEEAAALKIKKAKEAVEKAERDKVAAKEKADREKQEAIAATKRAAEERAAKVEADRLEKMAKDHAKKEAEKIAAEKKAANLNHKRKIDREVIASFVGVGWSEAEAEHIAGTIANGEISHVTINY